MTAPVTSQQALGPSHRAGLPSEDSLRLLQARAQAERPGLTHYLGWGVTLTVLAWAWHGAEIRPLDLVRDSGNIGTYGKEFFPPDFTDWRLYVREMVVTLQIALWGTLLAIVLAVPMGLLSAHNIAPAWVHQPVRRLMDACRAINEMVFAMLFIVAVGLGPFAGVLALMVHTTGTLAKLYSEAVEAIDPQPVLGIRATGAHRLVEILYGVIADTFETSSSISTACAAKNPRYAQNARHRVSPAKNLAIDTNGVQWCSMVSATLTCGSLHAV